VKKSLVFTFVFSVIFFIFFTSLSAAQRPAMRPPAVPLVVHDPYFSIWSPSDRLTDSWPCHWTGARNALSSMVRIDGKAYRLMGLEPKDVPAMKQTGLQVLPTRTIYDFDGAGVHVRLTFTTPLLPHDLDLISRPVTYLTWNVKSTDERMHQVSVYFDASVELCVNDPKEQAVLPLPLEPHGLAAMGIGHYDMPVDFEQPILKKAGDNLRIDWGYLCMAVPKEAGGKSSLFSSEQDERALFADGARSPDRRSLNCRDQSNVTVCEFDLGNIGLAGGSRHLLMAYDDIYSIEYFGKKLRPYWRRNKSGSSDPFSGTTELLETAEKQYEELSKRCEKFDRELMADMTRVGGEGYANLCALAYRQAIGGHKLAAGPDGRPMMFPKECFSNGCISTVDVLYPAGPIFMLFSNELLKATTTPVFEYAAMPRWKFPFAPHDLGTYPKANGQVYGGRETSEENQMPVEESGNMLILAAMISHLDGNTKYVEKYWPLLERWARYVKEKGLDPSMQLCTDDFTGHLAHNTNLSIKAITALGAYARMCDMAGKKQEAAEYRRTAEAFARQWVKMADDGDHYRLAFDRPNTWSQKYNLVWDKLLGLHLFPPEVAAKEVAFYKTKLNQFGLPLDFRADYTKTDWTTWTATLAASRADFDALMGPLYGFVSHTPQRVPLTDWYVTKTAAQQGCQARPVIGGVFIKMLDDRAVWDKWRK
jgi:hypothetical protein